MGELLQFPGMQEASTATAYEMAVEERVVEDILAIPGVSSVKADVETAKMLAHFFGKTLEN